MITVFSSVLSQRFVDLCSHLHLAWKRSGRVRAVGALSGKSAEIAARHEARGDKVGHLARSATQHGGDSRHLLFSESLTQDTSEALHKSCMRDQGSYHLLNPRGRVQSPRLAGLFVAPGNLRRHT